MTIADGYKVVAAIVGLTVLESINMIVLKQDGTVLQLVLVAIAGLGGWGMRATYEKVKK